MDAHQHKGILETWKTDEFPKGILLARRLRMDLGHLQLRGAVGGGGRSDHRQDHMGEQLRIMMTAGS